MPGLATANASDIMQAVENSLIAYGICTTNDPIYWLQVGQDPPAKPTGIRDILIVASQQAVDKGAQTGGGRIGLRFELLLEVHLRTNVQTDRVNTNKDRLSAHFVQKTNIVDALETKLGPSDTANFVNGNYLTVYGLRKDSTIMPHPDRTTTNWGDSVGIWRCMYMPPINYAIIG